MKRRVLSVLLLLVALVLPCAFAEGGFSSNPDAIEKAARSVLMLEVFDVDNNLIGTGSGFVAFNNRTIVTNYHVIDGADWVLANSDLGYQYMVTKVLVADEEKDIAICSFMSPTDLIPLELNVDGPLKRAESIVAIGSPKGITNTVSLGNISALYEEAGIAWIQFTAPISPGSSGGALFDDVGRIVGVTSASILDTQNINLAVHVSEVEKLYQAWDGEELSFAEYLAMTSVMPSPEPTPTSTLIPTATTMPIAASTPEAIATLKPKPIATNVAHETLRIGDSGESVEKLQQALIELGYLNDVADGVFGEKTGEAVRLFHMQHNIGESESDSVAWNTTQQLIFSGNAKPLHISQDAQAEWEVVKDSIYPRNKLRFHFEITNRSKEKIITKLEYVVWAEDAKGYRLGKERLLSTTLNLAPGSTTYSFYFALENPDSINRVYCAIENVEYSDGVCVSYRNHEYNISIGNNVVSWKIR